MSRVISYNINPNLNVQDGVHKTYFIIRGWKVDYQTSIDEHGFMFIPSINHYCYYYPQEFVAPNESGADKYLIFQYGRLTIDKHFPADIEIHASFIPRDNYCDSLVYYANLQPPDDNRKYKVNTNKQMGFEIWFTDSTGKTTIVPDNFVIFLKLIY